MALRRACAAALLRLHPSLLCDSAALVAMLLWRAGIHMWSDNWGRTDVPFAEGWLLAHMQDAALINKPLVLEEFGKASGPYSASPRQSLLLPLLLLLLVLLNRLLCLRALELVPAA